MKGFSLIELLTVIAIIAIAMSMVVAFNGRQRDSMQVRNAAQELASVLRQTRSKAIEQKAYFAVSFNMANGKGTSGRIPNNRDGGHWYRVLGPSPFSAMSIDGNHDKWQVADNFTNGIMALPEVHRLTRLGNFGYFQNRDIPVKAYLDLVAGCWESPPHVLPARSVRFLALTDQDNGARCSSADLANPAQPMRFQPTYPRPWFGTWDAAGKRWYPWGGYDHAIADASPWWNPRPTADGSTASSSGFYYEGVDGEVHGSLNPSDRLVWQDKDKDGLATFTDPAEATPDWPLWRQGESRPLLNGDWLDAMIVFSPAGHADFRWFTMRRQYSLHAYHAQRPQGVQQTGNANTGLDKLGMGDRSNVARNWGGNSNSDWGPEMAAEPNVTEEASPYVDRSGFFYITLGRDATDDQDTFSSPQALINSLMPAVRVGVSRLGEVRIVPVRQALQAGDVLDTTAQGTWFESGMTIGQYRGNLLSLTGRERPVDYAVTPEMIANRQWWLR